MDQKVPFWQFFRQSRDGCALLVRPSIIPHWISKILYVWGSYAFLAMVEGKVSSFSVQSGKKKLVWNDFQLGLKNVLNIIIPNWRSIYLKV